MNDYGCNWSDLTDDQKSQVITALLDRMGLFIAKSDYDSAVNLYEKPKDDEPGWVKP